MATKSSKTTAIGMSLFMWISPILVPIYCGIKLMELVPLRDTDRSQIATPTIVQMWLLFGAATVVTGVTHVMTLRLVAKETLNNERYRQARTLLKKALKTTALQFFSASLFQVCQMSDVKEVRDALFY